MAIRVKMPLPNHPSTCASVTKLVSVRLRIKRKRKR